MSFHDLNKRLCGPLYLESIKPVPAFNTSFLPKLPKIYDEEKREI
jgi:hypothetical protein